MTNINDYIKILETVGTLIRVSSVDCKVYDWKSSCLNTPKRPANQHFKFAPVKRIILSKSKQNKRGKTITSLKPNIGKGVQINTAKIRM